MPETCLAGLVLKNKDFDESAKDQYYQEIVVSTAGFEPN